jgi:hypothetical protein
MLATFSVRSLALMVSAGVALGLAGCGNEPGPGYATQNSGGVAYDHAALTKDTLVPVTTAAAVRAGSVHLVMSMSGKAGLRSTGDIAYAGPRSSMAMAMTTPEMRGRRITLRYVDQLIYMQIQGLTPPGKFVAINPADKTSTLARSFAATPQQMDPMASVKSMQPAVRKVERVGKGTMAGTPVDHYKITVDTAKILAKLGPAAQHVSLPNALSYDMWLDSSHLIRRMTVDMAGISVEMSLSRWGKAVSVRRPSPGQILRMPPGT